MTDIKRVVVRGGVQGVGFRAWTEREARRHALCGWVRNRRDGSVEAVFCGSPERVAAMIADCWNGPPVASVEFVDVFVGSSADLALAGGETFVVLATH